MEGKFNEGTPQRKEDHIVDAPKVHIDLPACINQLKEESSWSDSDRNSLTVFKSDTMRIVLIGLHANAELKPHKANGVISVQVLEGTIRFSADQQTSTLNKGMMIALHENIIHSVTADTEAFFLLTMAMHQPAAH